jgi:bifunctional non-homologous end joining protein LigD
MTQRRSSARGSHLDVEIQLRAIERSDGEGEVEFGRGASLKVSNLGKAYFPDDGVTKGALMRYYAHIWPVLQPHVKDRPLVLKRYPEGVGGPVFFQQNAGASVPAGVRVEIIDTVEEGSKPRIVGGDLLTLLYTVQLGAIEVHPWLSRLPNLDTADRCLIDLDPGADAPFSAVVVLAREILRLNKECALPTAVKTSGSRGIHLVIPLPARTSYDTSAHLAKVTAQVAALHAPERATVERSLKARPKGTIYVDAMQNARGKSMACAYSVRAKSGATVSAPVREAELTSRLRSSMFTMRTMPARISRSGDLWAEALAERPTAAVLARAIKVLEQILDEAPTAIQSRRRETRPRAGGEGAETAGGRRRVRRN